jgi:hypothetical protein
VVADQMSGAELTRETLAPLWQGDIHWFSDWPVGEVPNTGSLVYTIWDRAGVFVYVGISGRTAQMSPRSKGPLGRILSHARGNRSGDQFLIYVCDRLVLPRLGNRISEVADGSLSLDRETRAYVAENLGFRWISVSSPAEAFRVERELQLGRFDPPGRPLLNPGKMPLGDSL